MSRDMSFEMQEMLSSMRASIRNVVPIKVKFGKRTFYGCKYTVIRHYEKGMMAVIDGRHKEGEEYTEERIDLIGAHPEKMRNRANFVFTHENKEWYICCWYPHDQRNEFHPFGKQFGLSVSGDKIDRFERFTYPRIPMTIEPQE